MIIWVMIANTIDNVIKPHVISHGGGTPMIIIVLDVLGGTSGLRLYRHS